MWYVYQGTNRTIKEIYFGVSKTPVARIDGSHCRGGTVALADWDCDGHKIEWQVISEHATQAEASAVAHTLEETYAQRGYTVIQTAGI